MAIQLLNWMRVTASVKGAHLPGNGGAGRRGNLVVVHDRLEPFPTELD